MATLGELYANIRDLCKQWFYTKDEITSYLNNKISKSNTVGLVKNDGSIDTTNYSTFSGDYDDLTDKPNIPSKTSDLVNDGEDGTNAFIDESDSRLSDARTPKSHSHGHIANSGVLSFISTFESNDHILFADNSDSNKIKSASSILAQNVRNTNAYSNLGTNANDSQLIVNNAIDTAIGNLSSIKAIEVVSTKPTASSSTMGKLYIISENNKVNVYYTKEDNGSYSWHEMDADILDDLSIDWSDIQNKPSIPTKTSDLTNDGDDGTNVFVKNNDSRLSDARTPTSHNHGAIGNDGKFYSFQGNTPVLMPNCILVSDNYSEITGMASLSTTLIKNSSALTNIGTSANATQRVINTNIDTALGNKADTSDLGAVALSNSYDDLDNLPTLFSGDYDDLTNKPNIPQGVVVDTTLSSSSNNAIANSTVTTALNGKVDTNDSRLSDARTPTSHTHGYVQNGGTLTQTGTNNGSIVVTNSSNKLVVESSIDVLDDLIQDLITYGSS